MDERSLLRVVTHEPKVMAAPRSSTRYGYRLCRTCFVLIVVPRRNRERFVCVGTESTPQAEKAS